MANSINYDMRKYYIEAMGLSILTGPGVKMTLNDAMKAFFANPPASGGGGGLDLTNSTGTLNADKIVAGSTNAPMTAVEKTKLSGIATGATANSSDATLLDRANHTGTESADVLTPGSTNTPFTLANNTKLGGIATGATANSSDATLLARANHTGTQSADTLTAGSTNTPLTVANNTKLAGIATGATANDTDANLKNRANHTGTQAASTLTALDTAMVNNAGPFLNATGQKQVQAYTGSAWPTRAPLSGYTGPIAWNSENNPGAPAPTAPNANDNWDSRDA